jgi:hypothetical protein
MVPATPRVTEHKVSCLWILILDAQMIVKLKLFKLNVLKLCLLDLSK